MLHGLRFLNRIAQLIQGLLLLLFFGITGSGCSLADLFFNLFEAFFDGFLVLGGVSVVAVLRSAVIEHLFTLLDSILELLALDRIVCGTRLVGSVAVRRTVAQ
jgi:hypothetical protein